MWYHGNERVLEEKKCGFWWNAPSVVDELAPSHSVVTSNLSARHVYRAEIPIYNRTAPIDVSLSQIHMKKNYLDAEFLLGEVQLINVLTESKFSVVFFFLSKWKWNASKSSYTLAMYQKQNMHNSVAFNTIHQIKIWNNTLKGWKNILNWVVW